MPHTGRIKFSRNHRQIIQYNNFKYLQLGSKVCFTLDPFQHKLTDGAAII